MNFIQTYYPIEPKGLENTCGFLTPEFHWMSWALSCLQIKKFYDKVILYTNDEGKHILIDQLQLPYTDVVVEHNHFKMPHKLLFGLVKIFTYSLQKEPFVHVDSDFYLWSSIPKNVLQAELFAQNPEIDKTQNGNVQAYIAEIDKMYKYKYNMRFFENIKEKTTQNGHIVADNMGIFGSNDIDFVQDYCRKVFQFVDNNLENFNTYRPSKANTNLVTEQLFFTYLAKEKNKKVSYLMDKLLHLDEYGFLNKIYHKPQIPFTHLVGDFKRNARTIMHVEKILQHDYPQYYERIISVCKNNLTIAKVVNKKVQFFIAGFYETPPKEVIKFMQTIEGKNVEDINWNVLQEKYKYQRKHIEYVGSCTHEDLCKLTFTVNEFYKITDASKTTIQEICKYNRLPLQTYTHLLLIPEPLYKNIEIQLIDGFDLLFLNYLKQCKTYEDLLDMTRKHFNQQANFKENEYQDFIRLKFQNALVFSRIFLNE